MKRPLMIVGIPFLTTVFALFYISPAIVLVFAILGLATNYFVYYNKAMLVIIIISIVFAFNIFNDYQQNDVFDTAPFNKVTANITAQVLDKTLTSSGNSVAYTIKILDSDIEDLPNGFKGIVYADFPVYVDYYDIINVNMVCNSISNTQSFDFTSYYQSNGISLQFFSYATPTILESNNTHLLYKAKHWNESLCSIFDSYFTSEFSGMIKAMLLGYDRDLDDLLYHNAKRTGVSHIFVVSGLHIALLIGLLVKFLNSINFDNWFGGYTILSFGTILKQIICITVTWIFVLITGFGIPAVRAGVMMTALLSSSLFGRTNDSLNTLFGAGTLIVAINPFCIISLSFQLSFCATLAIIVFSQPITNMVCTSILEFMGKNAEENKLHKIPVAIISTIATTISANIGMIFVSLTIFKGISVVSILANLLITPLLPIVLISGVFVLLTNFYPPLSGLFYSVALIFLFVIKRLTNFFAELKFAYLGLDYPIAYHYFIALAIIIALVFVLKINYKRVIAICIPVFTLGLLIFSNMINSNILTLTVFSSDDGISILLSRSNVASIINFTDNNRTDIDIVTYLQSKNVNQVDNYVNFNQNSTLISDMLYLKETTPINKITVSKNDIIKDFINYKDITLVTKDIDRIFAKNRSYLDIFYDGEDTYILGEISNMTVLITKSLDIANSIDYDILLIDLSKIADLNTDNIIIPQDKTVIILNDVDTIRQSIEFKI